MSSQALVPERSLAGVPMVDLRAQHAALKDEILGEFERVLSSGQFVLGETVAAFEEELAALCGSAEAVGCNSGTDALWLALRALGVGPGDAVLCPAYSFFASASSIVRTGATPVFADIDRASFNLDPGPALETAIRLPNLKAVLSVDLFGRLAELGPLAEYCRDQSIPIVEDAAQSIDARDREGRGPGAAADVTCLSFYPTKNVGALGDAGAVLTGDPALAQQIRQLRVHGESAPGRYEAIGINSRMDALQAAALRVKLRHLESWTRRRGELAAQYDRRLAGHAPHLITPESLRSPARHGYHRYVVRVDAQRREGLIAALGAAGIASEIYYPMGLHQQPALRKVAGAASAEVLPVGDREDLGRFPETECAAREALALPLYPEMADEDIQRVSDAVLAFLASI